MRVTLTRSAAAITALASGALAVYALQPDGGSSSSTAESKRPAAEVRTQVIRRTIHITRHEKPRHPAGAATPSYGGSVRTASSGSTAGGSASAPVSTRSSGAGGGSESDHEGGGDD